jgi:hypothetical protein
MNFLGRRNSVDNWCHDRLDGLITEISFVPALEVRRLRSVYLACRLSLSP